MRNSVMIAHIAASAVVSTEVLNLQGYARGTITIPATWTSSYLAFKARLNTADTLVGLYDRSNALVKVGVIRPSTVIALPDEVFKAREIQLWSVDSAGADNAQAAASQLRVYVEAEVP
jgi:hypothetical protein